MKKYILIGVLVLSLIVCIYLLLLPKEKGHYRNIDINGWSLTLSTVVGEQIFVFLSKRVVIANSVRFNRF